MMKTNYAKRSEKAIMIDAKEILVDACVRVDRSELGAVQSLLNAIFYLSCGRYPLNHMHPGIATMKGE